MPATYFFYLNAIMIHKEEELEEGEVVMANEDALTFERLHALTLNSLDDDICRHPFPPVMMVMDDDPTLCF